MSDDAVIFICNPEDAKKTQANIINIKFNSMRMRLPKNMSEAVMCDNITDAVTFKLEAKHDLLVKHLR